MSEYNITSEDTFYRRFPKNNPHFYKMDKGKMRLTSAVFKTRRDEDGLSVNIAELTTPKKSVLDSNKYGLCEFSAKVPIDLGLECKHDPMPDNNSHALIIGVTKSYAKKISLSVSRILEQEDIISES